jgi:hypothetical protein
MKKITLIALVSIFNFQFSIAQQTYTQPIPRQVTEIQYSPSTRVTSVTQSGESAIVVDSDTVVATVKRNVMTIMPYVKDVKILLNEKEHPVTLVLIPEVTAVYTKSNLIAREGDKPDDDKPRSIWRSRDVKLDFAWGFHNWGTTMLNGFEGVEGDAAIRTSFNHIHLSVNYPLIGTRRFATYIGLGLEWDKYKFTGHDITFNTAAEPYAFADGGDPSCTSWLNTRYVILPVSFRFDFGRGGDWSLTLSAIPGIHWGGSHTGLRRERITDLEERLDRDQSVNKYINPYRLDVRLMLQYESIGLYFQMPTLSTLRSNSQELYPLKFGFALSLD